MVCLTVAIALNKTWTPLNFVKVTLQTLLTSKFIGFFKKEVGGWFHKLTTADAVISIFMEDQVNDDDNSSSSSSCCNSDINLLSHCTVDTNFFILRQNF
jgi:hypothetical protein